MSSALTSLPTDQQPVWEIARLFPDQGAWDEEDYLALQTNHLVEFADGCVDILPMPTTPHQLIVGFLYTALSSFVAARGLGVVAHAPLRVRVRSGKFREPDVLFMRSQHLPRVGEQAWEGADFVMEVVSDDEESRNRDYKAKPRDYASAGIPEFWIVDPQLRRIRVLRLSEQGYVAHGDFFDGDTATSHSFAGFEVDVTSVFEAGKVPGASQA